MTLCVRYPTSTVGVSTAVVAADEAERQVITIPLIPEPGVSVTDISSATRGMYRGQGRGMFIPGCSGA